MRSPDEAAVVDSPRHGRPADRRRLPGGPRHLRRPLKGDTAWIDQKNAGPGFVWHHVVKDGQGKARAVLQIWGDQNESFHEYEAVAEAAERAGKKAGT